MNEYILSIYAWCHRFARYQKYCGVLNYIVHTHKDVPEKLKRNHVLPPIMFLTFFPPM